MVLKNVLLVVSDMQKSLRFYKEVLGLRVTSDLGANVSLTGGLALQTLESYAEFIKQNKDKINFEGNDAEVYFEEDEFDNFLQKLEKLNNVDYVHKCYEHRWGQRVVRLYDPDKHIIEIGENMKAVCKRFLNSEMTVEEIAFRMDVPVGYVKRLIK